MKLTGYINTKEVGLLLSYSENYTRQKIITRADFPKPYKIGNGHKRWKRAEVLHFVEKYKLHH